MYIYFKGKVEKRGSKDLEIERCPELDQAAARSQKICPELLYEWQGPKHLDCDLLPYQEHYQKPGSDTE